MKMRRARKIRAAPEKAADPHAVRIAAVAMLAGRDFASGELQEKLTAQGYDRDIAAEAVAELVEGGILNDARYAEHYVAHHANRGQGSVRISGDMKALGLPAELIETALATHSSWPALAREVRIRKFGLEVPSTWAEKGRQARFLQYRGFSSDHIRAAFDGDFDPDGQS
jgi:regulatory protein